MFWFSITQQDRLENRLEVVVDCGLSISIANIVLQILCGYLNIYSVDTNMQRAIARQCALANGLVSEAQITDNLSLGHQNAFTSK